MKLEYTECYYGCNEFSGNEFLWISHSMFIYGDILAGEETLTLTSVKNLEGITLALKEGRISKEELEKNDWEIRSIIIPGRYIGTLNNINSKKVRALNRIKEIVFSSYASIDLDRLDRDEYESLFEEDEEDEWN